MVHHIIRALFVHGAKHATKHATTTVVQQAMVKHASKAAVVTVAPWMTGAKVRKHTAGFLAKISRWGLSFLRKA